MSVLGSRILSNKFPPKSATYSAMLLLYVFWFFVKRFSTGATGPKNTGNDKEEQRNNSGLHETLSAHDKTPLFIKRPASPPPADSLNVFANNGSQI